MTPGEQGFLLLTSQLGDPERRPLTVAQLRELTARVRAMEAPKENRNMTERDLIALGYGESMAGRILRLLSEKELLEYYLHKGARQGCVCLTRVSPGYPLGLRKRLREDSPGCLWAKGDLSLLESPGISLVGSRDLREDNRCFAREAGLQAAKQGFVLVSGNARGADRTAQEACLSAGGYVISVVADCLGEHPEREGVLYLSEDCFDGAFSPQRAHSRNRVIHALSPAVLVAQSGTSGGTWSGTVKNLRSLWSGVYCFDDGSKAVLELERLGARLIDTGDLRDLQVLRQNPINLFDQ